MIRRIVIGVVVGLIIVVAVAIASFAYADERTAPQEQASALAVPEVVSTMTGAIAFVTCNKMFALYLIDSLGEIHTVPMEGMTDLKLKVLLSTLNADKVHALILPCGVKDGTPL